MADSEAIASFTAITGATAEEATFFLGAANGDVNAAIDSFLSNDGGAMDVGGDEPPAAASAPPPVAAAAPPQRAAPSGGMGGMGGMGAGGSSGQRRRGGGGSSGNVRSLSDMKNEEEEDDHENEYYTGGEKSGMMVQDPKSRKDGNDVEGLFNRARAAGATDGTPDDLLPPGARGGGGRSSAFQGTGRTLSGDPAPAAAPSDAAPAAPQPVVHTITFWHNGFTVNDGDLRSLEDPANRPFMESIGRGECPRELESGNRDVPVHVNLVRKDAEWTPPPEPKYRAFHGTGRTLGGDDAAAAPAPTPAPPAAEGGAAGGEMVVDDSQPVTSIQIRLNDGTRLVARFNHTHTVGDIRRFITFSRPGSGAFRLMTSFPTKELANNAETIEAAGLVNAVVIQK